MQTINLFYGWNTISVKALGIVNRVQKRRLQTNCKYLKLVEYWTAVQKVLTGNKSFKQVMGLVNIRTSDVAEWWCRQLRWPILFASRWQSSYSRKLNASKEVEVLYVFWCFLCPSRVSISVFSRWLKHFFIGGNKTFFWSCHHQLLCLCNFIFPPFKLVQEFIFGLFFYVHCHRKIECATA